MYYAFNAIHKHCHLFYDQQIVESADNSWVNNITMFRSMTNTGV